MRAEDLGSRNILYVGQVEAGATCRDRMLALEDLGCGVEAFDTSTYLRSGPRIVRSLAQRWNIGPRIRRLNADLATLASRLGASRFVWIDKGRWICPATLAALRRKLGGPLIHFTPDAQFKENRSRHFQRCVPLYDALITTKPFEVEDYWNAGARRLILTGQSYDEPRAAAARRRPDLASDVCFIGRRQPHYQRTVSQVAQEEINFKVWGPGWPRVRRDFVQGPGLWAADYWDGLKSARIGLGLLSKRIPETSTTRTFEIPACGTLLVAERTPEHERYFAEGGEAEFFDGPEEMREKIRFYIRNEAACRRVGEAGRRKCEQAGYGNRARLRAILKTIGTDRDYADLRFGE